MERKSMLNTDSKFLDGIAKAAGNAAGIANGLRQQIQDDLKMWIEERLSRMDLVRRDEFDRTEAMLVKARNEQDEMLKRIEALEAALEKGKKVKK
jgi:BMFP domain-containing protein YqiC|tara:strand:- start:126 stop:410 length:285 start_codon:yes stop_codon:yes gene_type:complete